MVAAFDHGPLGLGTLAAHGHADALSVQLFIDGSPLIADPGTFVYNADSSARARYRSTATHSTVCLGGRDQSEQLGPFLWGRKAAAGLVLSDEASATVTASHDGYAPATHSRTVQLDGALLKVEDCLSGCGPCETSANFLLVGCEANRLSAKRVDLLRRDGLRIEVSCEGGKMNVEPASWSPCYLVEEPALRLRVVPEGPEWATIFSIGSVIS